MKWGPNAVDTHNNNNNNNNNKLNKTTVKQTAKLVVNHATAV